MIYGLKISEQGSLLLHIGKHHAKKDMQKLRKCVNEIKNNYKSLQYFSNHTNFSWTQFRRYCKVVKNIMNNNNKLYKRKLSKCQISDIQDHILSEESSFPLPDRKYAGKRFMKFNMKRCHNMYNLLDSTTRKVSLSTFY